jgi:hypothetical protein
MPTWVVDLLACWKGRVSQNDLKIIWNLIASCLMWCIWRKRNARSFNDCKKMSSNLPLYFFKSLLEWISLKAFLNIFNSVDFCVFFSCS